jgi:hypothetical protein
MTFARQKAVKVNSRYGRGFALLLLLVAVAILALLYIIQMGAFFGPVVPGAKRTAEHRPWLDEDRIVPSDKLIKPPRPPKPAISEPLTLSARVRMDGNDRGTATLEFAVSGEVKGVWYSEYSNEDRDYTMEATFAGNIDIDKTYSMGELVDESRLYFITKGTYKQTIYNVQTGSTTLDEGLIYATGWLHTDYSVSGLLTITTDKTWSASYELETER